MIRAAVLLLLFAPALNAQVQHAAPADAARLVILSDRVGPVIDAESRQRFHLFEQFDGFVRAAALQMPDSSFALQITLAPRNSPERDTLVPCSLSLLKSLSEKIEFMEQFEEGTYRLGEKPATLHLADGKAVVPKVDRPGSFALPARPPSTPGRRYGPIAIAPEGNYPRFRQFPVLDVGAGLRTYTPDFAGMEDVYGDAAFSFQPMFWGSLEVAISEVLGIQVDCGLSGGSNQVWSGTVGGVCYAHPFNNPRVRPFIGGGLAVTSMHVESNGIDADAGATGFYVLLGLEYIAGRWVGVDAFGGYSSFARVSTTFLDGTYDSNRQIPLSLKLSSAFFGIRLKFLQ